MATPLALVTAVAALNVPQVSPLTEGVAVNSTVSLTTAAPPAPSVTVAVTVSKFVPVSHEGSAHCQCRRRNSDVQRGCWYRRSNEVPEGVDHEVDRRTVAVVDLHVASTGRVRDREVRDDLVGDPVDVRGDRVRRGGRRVDREVARGVACNHREVGRHGSGGRRGSRWRWWRG